MLAFSKISGPMDRAPIAPEPLYISYLYMLCGRILGEDPSVTSKIIVPGNPYLVALSRTQLKDSAPVYGWWELLEQAADKPAQSMYAVLTLLHPSKDGHHRMSRGYRPGGAKTVRGSDLLNLLFDLPRVRQEQLHLRPKELQSSPDRSSFADTNSEELQELIKLAEKSLEGLD